MLNQKLDCIMQKYFACKTLHLQQLKRRNILLYTLSCALIFCEFFFSRSSSIYTLTMHVLRTGSTVSELRGYYADN